MKCKTTIGMQSYGNAVKIRHTDYYTDYKGLSRDERYAHLSSYLVKNGGQVRAGEIIGYTGNTGNSAGTRLYFEVILDGTHRNPLAWLDDDFTLAWTTIHTYGLGGRPCKKERSGIRNDLH